MANGFRITAIVFVVIGCISMLVSFSFVTLQSASLREDYALDSIQTAVQGLFFVALAVFLLLLEYIKESKKK